MKTLRDLTVHEKAMIIEGLIRVQRNGEQMAAETAFKKETRDGYQHDADTARTLATNLRREWWGFTEEKAS